VGCARRNGGVCSYICSAAKGNRETILVAIPVFGAFHRSENGELIAYQLDTNHTWFQQVVNLSPAFVAAHQDFYSQIPVEWDAYNVPYHFYANPPSVLVLGAGMGNDVAAALRNGAGHVVAVEINPLVQHLGRDYHFERPYSSPRVTPVVNDARSYIENSHEKFDLIVYSLLDSHTNISIRAHRQLCLYGAGAGSRAPLASR
jgi:hypothetical protein